MFDSRNSLGENLGSLKDKIDGLSPGLLISNVDEIWILRQRKRELLHYRFCGSLNILVD